MSIETAAKHEFDLVDCQFVNVDAARSFLKHPDSTTIIVKNVGKNALFTSSFPFSPRPWPNVDQNVNVCARNCSVISQH